MKYITNNETIKYSIYFSSLLISYFLVEDLKCLLAQYIPDKINITVIDIMLAVAVNHCLVFKTISKYFFKIPILKNTIINFNGEWEGIGTSTYDNKKFGVTITIVQTLTTISINACFTKSKSEAFSGYIRKENDKEKLIYNYCNDPKNTEEPLDKHYGTIILEKSANNKLDGNYFTDRKEQTKGTLTLGLKNKNS